MDLQDNALLIPCLDSPVPVDVCGHLIKEIFKYLVFVRQQIPWYEVFLVLL